MAIFYALVVALIAGGALLLWWAWRERAATGLPEGAVLYSDTGVERAVPQPLISRRYGLVGKPDYLLEASGSQRGAVIPVEVKSRARPAAPPEGHMLQLATYCLIVEDLHGRRPTHGVLRYAGGSHTVPFTDELRRKVIGAAEAIRAARRATAVSRSHDDRRRCQSCGYRQACGSEALD